MRDNQNYQFLSLEHHMMEDIMRDNPNSVKKSKSATITLTRAVAERALGALIREDQLLSYDDNGSAIAALRQALALDTDQAPKTENTQQTTQNTQAIEAEAPKPMAEIWWDNTNDCAWQLKMLCEPACPQGERIPLYAGEYRSAPIMHIDSDGSFTVEFPNESEVTQADEAKANEAHHAPEAADSTASTATTSPAIPHEIVRLAKIALKESEGAPIVQDWQVAAIRVCQAVTGGAPIVQDWKVAAIRVCQAEQDWDNK